MISYNQNLKLEDKKDSAFWKTYFSWMGIFLIFASVFIFLSREWCRNHRSWDFFSIGDAIVVILAVYASVLLLFPAIDGRREMAALDRLLRDSVSG